MATDFLKENLNKNYLSTTSNPLNKVSNKGYGMSHTGKEKIGSNEFKKTTLQEIENYLNSGFNFSIKHSESEAKSMLKVLLAGNSAENDEIYANLIAKLTNMIESYRITSTIESEA